MIFSIVILSGGRSQRMGTMKQLLPWGNKFILQHLIDIAAEVNPEEIMVVLGHNADKISEAIKYLPIKVVVNTGYREGMSSSLKTALNHVSTASDTYVFMLGDQPLVTSDILQLLLSEHAQSGRGMTVPVYKGIKGRPVVIDKKYRGELMALRGELGARQIIDRYPRDVLEVEVDSEGVIIDIDTEQDYIKYRPV